MSTIQYYEIIHDVLPCYQQQGQGGIEINHRTAPWVLVHRLYYSCSLSREMTENNVDPILSAELYRQSSKSVVLLPHSRHFVYSLDNLEVFHCCMKEQE